MMFPLNDINTKTKKCIHVYSIAQVNNKAVKSRKNIVHLVSTRLIIL